MFTDLLDQPRRELEALRAQCAAQEVRIDSLMKTVAQDRIEFAAQLERISKLESLVVKCAMNSRTSIIALKSVGITPVELKVNEFTPFKDAGFTCEEYKHAGFTQFKQGGYTCQELKSAGFTTKDVKDAGFSSKEMIDVGITVKELKDEGFTMQEIKWTNKEIDVAVYKHAGFTYDEYRPYIGGLGMHISRAQFDAL